MAKNLVEQFDEVTAQMEAKTQEIRAIIKDMVAISEKTGVPFTLEPWEDFEARLYTPTNSKLDKLRKQIEKENPEKDFYDFEEYYRLTDRYDNTGWQYWRSSSLSC